ncbi:MAG: flagellar protein FliL [Bdellovibrio sp.]|nr:MAG: flagellar protein FliL [Bdellovibrio sp.]
MAEEAAKEPVAAPAPPASGGGKQNFVMTALAVLNMVVVAAVGIMIWKGRQKDAAEPKIEHVIKGEQEAQEHEAHDEKIIKAHVIPLETFIVNLAGSKGRRIFKVDMELEVNEKKVVDEIEQRKAQIRDIIIIILSGRTYDQISSKEGKNELRDEVKDTVNAFLTKGKITSVFFTNFLYN